MDFDQILTRFWSNFDQILAKFAAAKNWKQQLISRDLQFCHMALEIMKDKRSH